MAFTHNLFKETGETYITVHFPETQTVPYDRGQAGLTGTCCDQDSASFPAAHHGGHLDLVSRALSQVADGVGSRISRYHMGLLIPP